MQVCRNGILHRWSEPGRKVDDGHRSIAVYLLDGDRPRFMGTVGVPDRYPLPKVEQVVEVRYLYCHTGPDGKLMQAKYFAKVRDDIAVTECTVAQLKLKANADEPDNTNINRNEESHVAG